MTLLINTKAVNISLDQVDLTNRDFHVPSFDSFDSLASSIGQLGLLHPPFVKQTASNNFVPVLGRRRLEVLTRLKADNIEVRVIDSRQPDDQNFLMAFWDNFERVKRDIAIKAFVVKRFMELVPVETVAKQILPFIDVPPQGPKLERLRRIGCLEMPVLQALSNGRIQEKCAFILSRLSSAHQLALLKLISDLGLNSNKAFEVISHLFCVSTYLEEPITGLLARPEVLKILNDSRLALPEKASELRRLVKRWAFPDLSQEQEHFEEWAQQLVPPKDVILRPAQSFEDDSVTVEVRLSSRPTTEVFLNLIRSFLAENRQEDQ